MEVPRDRWPDTLAYDALGVVQEFGRQDVDEFVDLVRSSAIAGAQVGLLAREEALDGGSLSAIMATARELHVLGPAAGVDALAAGLREVVVDDLTDLTKDWLTAHRAVTTIVVPPPDEAWLARFHGSHDLARVQRTDAAADLGPAADSGRVTSPERWQHQRLDNGLEVFVVPFQGFALTRAAIAYRAGRDREPQPGLDGLLWEQTAVFDRYEDQGRHFRDRLLRLVSRWEAQRHDGTHTYGVVGPARHTPELISALHTLTDNIDFTTRGWRRTIRARRQATRRFPLVLSVVDREAAHLFGDHALGRARGLPPWPAPSGVHRSTLVEWSSEVLQPSNAALFIVGDVDPAVVLADLADSLGEGRPDTQPNHDRSDEALAPRPTSASTTLYTSPSSSSYVRLRCRLADDPVGDDRPTRILLQELAQDTVTEALRTRLQASYTPVAEVSSDPSGVSTMTVEAVVTGPRLPDAVLAVQMLPDTIRERAGHPSELYLTRLRATAAARSRLQTAAGVLSALRRAWVRGEDPAGVVDLPRRISTVSAADLDRVLSDCGEAAALSVVAPPDTHPGLTEQLTDAHRWEAP